MTIKNLLHSKINVIDLHFNYAPTGEGAKEAKNDFIKNLFIM